MKIGLFGGSFDPPHQGHLTIAQSFYQELHLDRVIFIPAHIAPQKGRAGYASAEQRCQMLQLAIATYPYFAISTIEIERQGVSYTIDTLRYFKEQFPHDLLYLLIGSDSLLDLPTWREPEAILQTAQVVVAVRPEHALDQARPEYLRQIISLKNPLVPISSSEIRQRIWQGQPLAQLLPPAVEQYIREQRLYRS